MRTVGLCLLGAFVLAACNLPQSPAATAPAAGIIRGTVWNDQCTDEAPAACVQTSAGERRANGLREADEPGLPGVPVELGAGPCPASGMDRTNTGSDGSYAFVGHGPGEYCVSLDLEDPQVSQMLPPGRLTTGEPSVTVELEPGQDLSGIDFGWEKVMAAATHTPRAQASPTPTAGRTEVTALVNANCRAGPGAEYPVLTVVLPGQVAEAVGRDAEAEWWLVRPVDEPECWLSIETVQANFNAADLARATPPPTPTASPGVIAGRVWHDRCGVSGEAGGLPTPSPGCIQRPDGSYVANGVREAGEPGLVGVLVNLGQGDCPATGLASTITASEGRYQFSGLSPGTYCVSVDEAGAINSSILVPGLWTRPPEVGQITIVLSAGEQLSEINFGWDYQFLP